jgi:hypothetical protein
MHTFKALLLAASIAPGVALAADPIAQPPTAGEFALKVVAERPRAYATVCVAKIPAMKADFDRALLNLSMRVENTGRPLLTSEPFSSLNKTGVPKVLVDYMTELNDELVGSVDRQLKDVDVPQTCQQFLSNLNKNFDGELLKAQIASALAGVQTALAAIEKGMLK